MNSYFSWTHFFFFLPIFFFKFCIVHIASFSFLVICLWLLSWNKNSDTFSTKPHVLAGHNYALRFQNHRCWKGRDLLIHLFAIPLQSHLFYLFWKPEVKQYLTHELMRNSFSSVQAMSWLKGKGKSCVFLCRYLIRCIRITINHQAVLLPLSSMHHPQSYATVLDSCYLTEKTLRS